MKAITAHTKRIVVQCETQLNAQRKEEYSGFLVVLHP